jgi:CheY-like chemotaxis protein
MAKILLVDDNIDLLKMMTEIIRRGGHEVTMATDGQVALDVAKKKQFDLLITDLIMPGKEGIETIMAFKKFHPATKIIAMSGGGAGVGAKDYLSIARTLGVASTLVKPFSTAELMKTVDLELVMER